MLSRWSLVLFGLVALAGTALACDGLSPGDQIIVGDSSCTLGFLVADPAGLYFSTAGHCIQVDEAASSPDFADWGTGAFHFLEPETGGPTDGSPGMDFGLIRVKPEFYADLNPKLCGWDGPVGIYDGNGEGGGVRHFGHGIILGDIPQTRAREGYFLRTTEDAFYFTGAGVTGDSGSAVLSQSNLALGVFTHALVGLTNEDNGGTRLQRGFSLAAEAGFPALRLVLAGEDPVAVLAELRGAPPAGELPTPATPTGATPRPTSQPPSNSSAPGSNGATTPRNDSTIDPASDDDGAPGATVDDAKGVPFLPTPALLALGVGLALVVARAKRKV